MIAPRLLSVPMFVAAALGVTWAPAGADDAACQAVLQAAIKQAAVPVHQKVTIESAAAPGKVGIRPLPGRSRCSRSMRESCSV